MNPYACANLWREVLLLTIRDALFGVRQGNLKKPMRIIETKAARDFLTKPSRDFDIVCAFAGIDPDAARERLSAAIRKAPPPEELLSVSAAPGRPRKRRQK
ncbi:hypothetical protein R5H32_05650 [Defluviimonas sp. D31]|uniref:hypothetical protein n=1 Tax=Defluviimonas sp. D31 TaxID=3083253 RepID=UPI00296EE1E8|nr:hypothetical protein [Defluviimonas sp. D31]MDW4548833.1 hypothetical protein [Defluviimonas sp. D31]